LGEVLGVWSLSLLVWASCDSRSSEVFCWLRTSCGFQNFVCSTGEPCVFPTVDGWVELLVCRNFLSCTILILWTL
jgi:hypothetical protein